MLSIVIRIFANTYRHENTIKSIGIQYNMQSVQFNIVPNTYCSK